MKEITTDRYSLLLGILISAAFGALAFGMTVPGISVFSQAVYLVFLIGLLIYLMLVPVRK